MFHIGQYIVCIKTHSDGDVKEGQVYTINSLKKGCCSILIDVGISTKSIFSLCFCGNIEKSNGITWFCESLFKPLDELSDISELLEVLNKENYQEV